MALNTVLIDWDWGATGIWMVSTSEPGAGPLPPESCRSPFPASDRHRAWRGRLTDDLIDALQGWNDRGDEVMGSNAHQHTDRDRLAFWARGRELAVQVQGQLGLEYEVICRPPAAYSA